MDSGTDTWVIVLAAFGGGLAGAVLQPLISYLLQLRTRKQDIEAEINQGLRRMIYAWLDRGTKVYLVTMDAHARTLYDAEPLTNEEITAKLAFPSGFPILQSWRIGDQSLQTDVDEYVELYHQSRDLCWNPTKDVELMDGLVKRMQELPRQITKRMDALGWPEANWEGVGPD